MEQTHQEDQKKTIPVPIPANQGNTVLRRGHGVRVEKRGRTDWHDDDEDQYTRLKRRRGPLSRFRVILVVIVIAVVLFVSAARLIRTYRSYRQTELAKLTSSRPVTAVNGALDLPRLYPPLARREPTSGLRDCQAAWDALVSVPCHARIFSRDWDNGTWRPLMTPSPLRYVPQLCQPECRRTLKSSSEEISAKCTADMVFNTTAYHGIFNTTWLESGPAEALEVILRRNDHSCRPSEGSGYDYCLIEMTERWGIMDGMNHANLQGIGTFLHATSKRRKDPGGVKTGTRGSGSDGGWSTKYRFNTPPLSYGPGMGETDCGSCTLQWFEQTLNAWEPSRIISPDTDLAISLPEHLRRLRQAGQRCESDQWNRIWTEGVQRYVNDASISKNWEDLPSGDYGWTLRNGLSVGDKPLPDLRAAKDLILASGTPQMSTPPAYAVKCLEKLHEHLISLPCDIHLTESEIGQVVRSKKHLLQDFCRDECSQALSEGGPALQVCQYKRIDRHEIAGPLVLAYNEAKATRSAVCRKAGRQNTLCAPVFMGLGRPQWAHAGEVGLADIQSLVDGFAQQPIPDVVEAAVKEKGITSTEEEALRKELPNWHKDLEAGACSPCVWEMVVGDGTISSAEQILGRVEDIEGFLAFAGRFYNACVDRGATWMGGLPYGGDDVIWRTQEVGGKVSRWIVDESKYGRIRGRWLRGTEGSTDLGWLRGTYGSIWHLRAAARRVNADREGRLLDLVAWEAKHRSEEDAKVWASDEWGAWEWKGGQKIQDA
ncbi:hypothetical protein BKA67DRAFT_654139 [Truncatella angustata]|uniref:Uncharacterized protein n=1 Tax=Truncatella angustata TaxID=152316 RepID=A0A9P9A2R1_9PEZI|nr:uncharacterized protein BKA67DRAFT_654139 [Truncatella angustata]KAH6660991.1 hypothetical protein BKA67DRAFT_654139 [Truncatella angustata]KAH8203704.1 hypothetical protein TruAng_002117 [Truncatella angustata]